MVLADNVLKRVLPVFPSNAWLSGLAFLPALSAISTLRIVHCFACALDLSIF